MQNTEILNAITKHLNANNTVKVVFSNVKTAADKDSFGITKIVMRPVTIKSKLYYQVETYKNNQVFHNNIEIDSAAEYIKNEVPDIFKQINIINSDITVNILVSKKGQVNTFKSKNSDVDVQKQINTAHNKEKSYILKEGLDIPVLKDLGIFTDDNQIIKSKYDKYKQINRFIEIIDEELKNYNKESITVLDFGCGKSYLTFVVYYYFKFIKNIDIKVIGYDLKADVIQNCTKLAEKYGYSNLTFIQGDVKSQKIDANTDMIITLHACDTATDYALAAAIKGNIEYVFSAPCCQHELNAQVSCVDEYSLLLKHGLIKERFSALLTDAVRCAILEDCGYKADIIEFVDFAHSPKNLMIRAKLNKNTKFNPKNGKNAENINKILNNFNCSQKLYEIIYK